MKQFAFMLTLSLISVFSLQAQSSPAISDDGAKITFDKEVVDYGTIKQGADPLRTFKFKNTGAGPLVITSATGSCGCTVPTYPQEPILPGASAEIKVKYDTQRIGAFTKTVTIVTNEKTNNTHTLTIKGTVEMTTEKEGLPTKDSGVFNNGKN